MRMRRLALTYCLLMAALVVNAQSDKAILHQGNKLYQQGQYQQADSLYGKVMSEQFADLAKFNRGDALFRANELEDAIAHFNEVAGTTASDQLKADALHNLGNAYLSSQKPKEAIEAYKDALRIRPEDNDTRYNLAAAIQMLKQQQNQQQNQDQQDQDQQNQDQQDQDQQDQQNQDQQNQDQQNQDQKDQDQQNQDQKDQNQQNQDQNQQNQQNQDQQNGSKEAQPHQISPQDAQRMLESLNKGEKEIQLQLQKAKGKTQKKKIEKDW